MDVPLSSAVSEVKMAAMEASSAAERRRLTVRQDIRCSPGCSSCCSRYVEITVAEALVIVDSLKSSGKWASVREEAQRQAPIAKRTPPDAWFKMNIPCPVLERESRLCSAHGVRPPVCSVHHAASDPAACDPWRSSSSQYVPVDFTDLFARAQSRIRKSLAENGILAVSLPMPAALLLADRISTKAGLSYDEAVELIRQEL